MDKQEIIEAEIDRQIDMEILGDDVIQELKEEQPRKKTAMEIMLGTNYHLFFK